MSELQQNYHSQAPQPPTAKQTELKCPSYIELKDWQEWLHSGVDPEIICLNVKTLTGDRTHEYLLEDALEKLGEGKQTPHSSQYVTMEVNRLLRRYSHTLKGGWWCAGIDPTNNYEPMRWGCFKPILPRLDPKKNKPIKYEHPPSVPTAAFFLRVPVRIWQAISDRHGIPIGNCSQFWEWVHINNLPIILCEGAKKAGALLSGGAIAVGLPGIYGAYRKIETNHKKHRLIPEIELFATPKRKINICFDNDPKPTTRLNVRKATHGTAKLLKAKKCQVNICAWSYQEKGIDDVLVAHGQSAVEKIIATALPIATWQTQSFYKLSRKINLNLNQKYLGNIFTNIPQKIIGVKSPKGTGKTESLKPLVEQLVSEGYSVYLISHRIQLCQALCGRLNIPYIDDVGSGRASRNKGFGIVIDSLHGQGKGQFDVEHDTHLLTNKYAVIIDEIEQTLWHLLSSSTEVQQHRTEVIKQLQLLLLNADKILGLDADLTDVSFDFIQKATGCRDDDFYLINNEYNQGGYEVTNYDEASPVNWLRDLLKAVDKGDKVLVATDSQKIKGKFSTQNIESILIKKFPHLKTLRIDSQTIADPDHPAYGCITKINSIITQYDNIIISPSVGTGISIDVRNHFAGVWGCFQGVQSENAVRQQLIRLRDNVPRHLWIARSGLSWQGDGSASLYSILSGNKKQFKIHLNQLRSAGFDIDESGINTNDSALNCYAKMACRINHEMADYRSIILENLMKEGHKIVNQSNDADMATQQEVTALRDENYSQEREDIAAIDISDLNDLSYQQLANQKAKTKLDRQRERKYSIEKRYGIEATPDLILKDDDGYYPQLRLHYYLAMGFEQAIEKDKKPAQKIKDESSVFLPDFNRNQRIAKLNLLRSLNIPEILQLDKLTESHELLKEMSQKVKGNLYDVGMFIGKLHPDMSGLQILRKILKLLGLTLTRIGREGSGDSSAGGRHRQWIYQVSGLKDGREQIFEKWYLTDTKHRENCIDAIPNPSQISNISNSDQDVSLHQEVTQHQNVSRHQDINRPKNCFVWDGQNWVGAVLHRAEVLASGTFKGLVTLWNGLDQYVWNASHISIC
ncbi:plasmid replication protein, CyRepA1 family [Nodularia sp. LEGE 04288]|uniref:plasmid replication protein, CyRepA1 family n=1 Tax=Nodularia sp. LEGE 04288 TaxID=1828639 RepID=UPI001D0FC499|nr:plasmid replication protein, CyRepA1 family [Nodularia sp. LEGE 04288]MCC2695340.1 DUF3854 domain-containing protein [Nodularia sp. LEGE 04288]